MQLLLTKMTADEGVEVVTAVLHYGKYQAPARYERTSFDRPREKRSRSQVDRPRREQRAPTPGTVGGPCGEIVAAFFATWRF